jgi:hypothetical protein
MRFSLSVALLASAAGLTSALPPLREVLNPFPKSDAAEKYAQDMGILPKAGGRYPKLTPTRTYNGIQEDHLSQAIECLSSWCEENKFLEGKYGRAACRTPDDQPGGGAMAYICNRRNPARCSRAQIYGAFTALRIQHLRENFTDIPTGYTEMRTGPKTEMVIGFDWYCEGGKCGDAHHPVWATCEKPTDRYRLPMQADNLVGEEDLKDYTGVPWEGIEVINEDAADGEDDAAGEVHYTPAADHED